MEEGKNCMLATDITPLDSPQKKQANLLLTRPDDAFDNTHKNSILQHLLSTSLTEKQIFSHPIIKEIIDKSSKKTVQHNNINLIPAQATLYRIPKNFNKNQFQFSSIPPNDQNFMSTSSQKVVEINRRLSQSKGLPERLQQIAERNKSKVRSNTRERAQSAGDKRVSISGLISYNFNSVNARRSLGNIPDSPQEVQLSNKIKSVKERNSCRRERLSRIIGRKPTNASKQRQSISNAAVCDFHTTTDKFLKLLTEEKDRDSIIFGQKMQKLNCIKQYMQKQKVQYNEAEFIVQEIQKAQKKKPKIIKKRAEYSIDDDAELEKRRIALKKKRVMPKHFYFTQ